MSIAAPPAGESGRIAMLCSPRLLRLTHKLGSFGRWPTEFILRRRQAPPIDRRKFHVRVIHGRIHREYWKIHYVDDYSPRPWEIQFFARTNPFLCTRIACYPTKCALPLLVLQWMHFIHVSPPKFNDEMFATYRICSPEFYFGHL